MPLQLGSYGKENPFLMTSYELINESKNHRLDSDIVGFVEVFILPMPKNWQFSTRDLIQRSGKSRYKVQKYIATLKSKGFCKYERKTKRCVRGSQFDRPIITFSDQLLFKFQNTKKISINKKQERFIKINRIITQSLIMYLTRKNNNCNLNLNKSTIECINKQNNIFKNTTHVIHKLRFQHLYSNMPENGYKQNQSEELFGVKEIFKLDRSDDSKKNKEDELHSLKNPNSSISNDLGNQAVNKHLLVPNITTTTNVKVTDDPPDRCCCFSSSEQEKIDLVKSYSLSESVLKLVAKTDLDRLTQNLKAIQCWVERRGEDPDSWDATFVKAIKQNWKPQVPKEQKLENEKKLLEAKLQERRSKAFQIIERYKDKLIKRRRASLSDRVIFLENERGSRPLDLLREDWEVQLKEFLESGLREEFYSFDDLIGFEPFSSDWHRFHEILEERKQQADEIIQGKSDEVTIWTQDRAIFVNFEEQQYIFDLMNSSHLEDLRRIAKTPKTLYELKNRAHGLIYLEIQKVQEQIKKKRCYDGPRIFYRNKKLE